MTAEDRLDEAAANLRALISEAHAATKDLRKATAEAKALVESGVEAEVKGQISAEVRVQWERFQGQVTEAIELATDSVYKRFDAMMSIFTGRGSERNLAEMMEPLVRNKDSFDFTELRDRERAVRVRISRAGEGEAWSAQRAAVGKEPYVPIHPDGSEVIP